uniref:isopeptide-forming domain-containing fimbrial protein n=1 Tax=Bacillus multifaciens TaxID=3068506 RepID=UPI003F4948E3
MSKRHSSRFRKIVATAMTATMLMNPLGAFAEVDRDVIQIGHPCENEYQVTLKGNKVIGKDKIDLVLVQDQSGSFRGTWNDVKSFVASSITELRPDMDRIQVSGFRGDNGIINPDGSEAATAGVDLETPLHQSLTGNVDAAIQSINNMPVGGTTPSGHGIREALNQYEQAKGDTKDRKTVFMLVTDGAQNVREDGIMHLKETMQGEHQADYFNDWETSTADMLSKAQQVKDKGYEFATVYWEDDSYFTRVLDDRKDSLVPLFNDRIKQTASKDLFFDVNTGNVADLGEAIRNVIRSVRKGLGDYIEDRVNKNFEIVPGSFGGAIQPDKVSQEENKIHWDLSKVKGNFELTYKVKAKDSAKAKELITEGSARILDQDTAVKNVEVDVKPSQMCRPAINKTVSDSDEKDKMDLAKLKERKEPFQYKVNVSFKNMKNSKQVSIQDTLENVLEPTAVKLVDGNGKDVSSLGTAKIDGQKINFEFAQKKGSVSYLTDQNYTLVIDAKIKEKANEVELAKFIKEGGVPNKATLKIDDKLSTSNVPRVTPPTEQPKVMKKVSDSDEKLVEKANLKAQNEAFVYDVTYKMGNGTGTWKEARLTDELVNVLEVKGAKLVDSGGKEVKTGKLSINGNKVEFVFDKKDGSYLYLAGQTYMLKIDAKIKGNVKAEEIAKYLVKNGVPNTAQLNIGGNKPLISNEVYVVPPTEQPKVTKKESDSDEKLVEKATLKAPNEAFVYDVTYKMGNGTGTWKEARLIDELVNVLEVKGAKLVDSEGKEVKTGKLNINGNKIEFVFDKKDGSYLYLAGQTYTLKIDAKIKDNVKAEELAKYLVKDGVPNTAQLNIGGNKPLVSNEVYVMPPTEQPKVAKKVSDSDEKLVEKATLKAQDEAFVYDVTYKMGNGTGTWKEARLTDELVNVLEIKGAKLVDSEGKEVKTGKLNINGNKVEFVFDKKDGSYLYLAGQTYTLKIDAKIKGNVKAEELAKYLVKDGVPNTAQLNIGGNKPLVSNEVYVMPPAEQPKVAKKVSDSDEKLVEKATLKAQDEAFVYDVTYKMGNGTGTWKEARLTDELVNVLEIKGAKLVDSEGKEVKTGKLNINGNKVEFVFDKKDGSYLYLAGQTYTLKIDAKIKGNVKAEELAKYLVKDGVPNTAQLNIGGNKPLVSNEVYVMPPAEQPKVAKKVSDSDEKLVEKATLKAQDEAFVYDVTYKMGNGTGTWKEARLTDELVNVLEIKGAKLVDSEGKEVKTGKLNINGNKVEFVFDKKDGSYLYLAGQTYTLKIDAKIKGNVKAEELAKYLVKDGVPNTAQLNIGGNKPLVSNEVYVMPPAEQPKVAKKVSDSDEKLVEKATLKAQDEAFVYDVTYKMGNGTGTWKEARLTDELVNVLEIKGAKLVDSEGKEVKTGKLNINGNKVEFVFDKKDGSYLYLAGQTYTLKIDAKIKGNVKAEELAKYLVKDGVPNTAQLNIGGNKPLVSNEVYVMPPAEQPKVAKKVSDSDEKLVEKATLKAQDEAFVYDVTYKMGNGTGTWKEARLTDELVNVLEIKGAKLVDSEGKEVKTGKLNINGNKVEFVFDKKDGSYLYLAGQTYTLKIDAKIKGNVKAEELAKYLVKDGVPNTAQLNIGGNKPLVSNEVYVMPPAEQPKVAKKVSDSDEKLVEKATLKAQDEAFVYDVTYKMGNGTGTWKEARLTDELVNVLEIKGAKLVDSEGKEVKTGKLNINGNKVEFVFDKKDGSYLYLAGQTYTLKIDAKIKDDVKAEEIAKYLMKDGVPNTAQLNIGGNKPLVSNEVYVVPPTEQPKVTKKVSDSDEKLVEKATLKAQDEAFVYDVTYKMGNGTGTWKEARLTDELVNVLKVKGAKLVDSEGKEIKTGKLNINENKVEFVLDKKDDSYLYLAGQTYTLKIDAKIKDDVKAEELAPFLEKDGVPNTAQLNIGSNKQLVSNEVYVVSPKAEEPKKEQPKQKVLPQTNEEKTFIPYVLAAVFILAGLGLYYMNRKKQMNN